MVVTINKNRYCLVVTDDFNIFSWVFFLATKDETSEILCKFIIGLENQLNHNVKIIRCDNGTEFKNHDMNEFCAKKGIKKEFRVAKTPQQNGVAKRKNRTLIKAARTILADSFLPILFWAEAVNTACYVLNRVLVIKPQNKTPYELSIGNSPNISFMRPFGCPLTILNTLDSLGKFDGKSDEDQPNMTGTGPNWMFDLDFLTNSMNYIPVSVENQVNMDADSEDAADKEEQHQMKESEQDLQDEFEKMVTQELAAKAMDDVSRQAFEEEKRRITSAQATSTNKLSTDRQSVSTDRPSVSTNRSSISTNRPSVSTDRPSVSTNRPFVSIDRPSVSIASTPTGENAGESSFVYLGGKIPI
ncbi:putative ribonuclease H-like domain-containing protein, partial [Tanacetum coccineum]